MVREEAAKVIRSLNIAVPVELAGQYAVAERNWARCVELGDIVVDPLCALLRVKSSLFKWDAVKTLGAIGGERAVEALLAILNGEDGPTREAAVDALKLIGDPRGLEAVRKYHESPFAQVMQLIRVLKGKADGYHEEERAEAVKALGKIRDSHAIKALVNALNDWNVDIQQASAIALQEIGDPEGLEALGKYIAKREDRLSYLRERFPTAWIENPKSLKRLFNITASPNKNGIDCPYYDTGVCMVRVICQQNASGGPEECSLPLPNYRDCHVWKLYPR